MFYAGSFGGACCDCVAVGSSRAAMYKEQRIDAGQSICQRTWVGQIADGDFDAIGKAGARFFGVAHKDARTNSASEKALGDAGTDVACGAGDEISHGDLPGTAAAYEAGEHA